MSKYYQANSENWIPHTIYRRMIDLVCDYPYMVERERDIIEESPDPPDGMPRGSGTGDPTARTAARIERLHSDMKAYEQALNCIPIEYQQGILDNIRERVRFPDYADIKTWKKWKGRFLKMIAKNLDIL